MKGPAAVVSDVNLALSSDHVLETYIKRFSGGLTVMPNNICNARCVFCAYPQNPDPKSTMTLDQFKRALDGAFEIAHLGSLSLTPVAGDPLADPTLFDKIAYAKSRGVQFITFNTNGILLGRNDIYRKLLTCGLSHVGISTPGFDPAEYKAVFGVDRCNQLVEGLVKLGEHKRALGAACRTTIDIGVGFGTISLSQLQLPTWQALIPFFEDKTFSLAGGRSVGDLVEAARAREGSNRVVTGMVDNWSGAIKSENLPDNLDLKEVTHTTSDPPCWRVIDDVAVLPDGKVRVCSCRYETTTFDELVIGDLNEQPLSRILYGETHKTLVREIASGRWPSVCKSCTLYKPVEMSAGETRMLADAARAADATAAVTYPMNSSEGLTVRAKGKLALAKALIAESEFAQAFNHLHGALSYASELTRRAADDRPSQSLLAETHQALSTVLRALGKVADADQHAAAAQQYRPPTRRWTSAFTRARA